MKLGTKKVLPSFFTFLIFFFCYSAAYTTLKGLHWRYRAISALVWPTAAVFLIILGFDRALLINHTSDYCKGVRAGVHA